MLQYVSGDILLTKAQAIAHGIAPGDHFDSGLALSLRQAYPTMYKDFRHYCKTASPKAGSTWTWGGTGGVRVVNLFTQDPAANEGGRPGPATMQHVNHALKALADEVRAEGYASVALPRLATGVGRLDWADVKPSLEQHLGDLDVPVIVYSEFHAGVAADEVLPA